ncbi:vWA-like protein [Gonapodya prolifera JEL478]|uniref:VWA-like protein n=1 Tax=Gonapodya prolifera (strain JEL478) TaxID=1344416 RepID=A0A138ZWI8_GONPJ|nr:vWA-like protein [Gonapodya prolifera JEL478]|eukprot:KXS08866.1 vWA-like protein [Gonapodya prolifera JEL478]
MSLYNKPAAGEHLNGRYDYKRPANVRVCEEDMSAPPPYVRREDMTGPPPYIRHDMNRTTALPLYRGSQQQNFKSALNLKGGIAFAGCDMKWTAWISSNVPKMSVGVDLVFNIDVSGSMLGGPIEKIKKGIIDICNRNDMNHIRIAIVKFHGTSTVVQNFLAISGYKDQIIQNVEKLVATGHTAIYEGLQKSIALCLEREDKTRTASIITFTDGSDSQFSDPQVTYADIVATANHLGVPLHVVSIGDIDDSVINPLTIETNGIYKYSKDFTTDGNLFSQSVLDVISIASQPMLYDVAIEGTVGDSTTEISSYFAKEIEQTGDKFKINLANVTAAAIYINGRFRNISKRPLVIDRVSYKVTGDAEHGHTISSPSLTVQWSFLRDKVLQDVRKSILIPLDALKELERDLCDLRILINSVPVSNEFMVSLKSLEKLANSTIVGIRTKDIQKMRGVSTQMSEMTSAPPRFVRGGI